MYLDVERSEIEPVNMGPNMIMGTDPVYFRVSKEKRMFKNGLATQEVRFTETLPFYPTEFGEE